MPITVSRLSDEFYPVDELGGGLVRCGDELPKKVIHTYFLPPAGSGHCPFLVSDDKTDDDFARMVLETCGDRSVDTLTKIGLGDNAYGFTHFLCVPHTYHSELKGRLDAERPSTTLCVPIFRSEFSGTETPDEFVTMRREVVPTLNWDRDVTPKIALRFDSAKTRGGTGDSYVLAHFDLVLREIDNLAGVGQGFIEILNYAGAVVEILSPGGADFSLIPDRDDARAETLSREAVRDRLWAFLTE